MSKLLLALSMLVSGCATSYTKVPIYPNIPVDILEPCPPLSKLPPTGVTTAVLYRQYLDTVHAYGTCTRKHKLISRLINDITIMEIANE